MKTKSSTYFKHTPFKLFLTAIALLFSSVALALTLDEAKQQGLVGEQTNGYLGAIVKQNDVLDLINDINSQRKSKYAELADKNNISLQDVEKLAAKKAYERTESGQFILVNGEWVKK